MQDLLQYCNFDDDQPGLITPVHLYRCNHPSFTVEKTRIRVSSLLSYIYSGLNLIRVVGDNKRHTRLWDEDCVNELGQVLRFIVILHSDLYFGFIFFASSSSLLSISIRSPSSMSSATPVRTRLAAFSTIASL